MKTELSSDLMHILTELKASCRVLRQASSEEKNQALLKLAENLSGHSEKILAGNIKDLQNLKADSNAAFRDRLTLTEKRIELMVESIRQVAHLDDPVGETFSSQKLSNGLEIKQVRAPLGVIFMIFESRPNVITEAFSLAFKSGNAILLRGGSESKYTATALYSIIGLTLKNAGFVKIPFFGVEDYDRKNIELLLQQKNFIDVVVPRGGEKLIEFVQNNSLMPIIKNDRGLCHTYVAEDAHLEMAVKIVKNAKTHRPGVCNSLETVLVNASVAKTYLPKLYQATLENQLKWHVDEKSLCTMKSEIPNLNLSNVTLATDTDWNTEYLDLIMNCKVVENFDEALDHIAKYGSKHSEAIVTASETKAHKFQSEVDAAAVYWNASTRFTDGFEFGLGGELGISTQKLHVRGPVGLCELTTPRWIINGNGQIRN